ncbi:MAG: hypothetical protein Q7S40_17820 [Opitutaceae bacterium]|nr:hypothetical protein [Opitutaceae bacterium]
MLSFASFEDDLALRYLPGWCLPLLRRVACVESAMTRWVTRVALRCAQRATEHQARRQRASVLQRDHWLEDNVGDGAA